MNWIVTTTNVSSSWKYPLLLFYMFSMTLASAHSGTRPTTQPPEAQDDFVMVIIQKPALIDVLENDQLHGTLKGLRILDQPAIGAVKVNADHRLSYIPGESECEAVDRFTYIVANETGWDTVAVFVEILCERLTIFSGFSPNGDGEFDTFTIKGVELLPNNKLSIFDYNGQEIYQKNRYANDWDGSQLDEPLSTEYTYYYVFEDGEGNVYSGYFKVDS
ncbi:MAG: gliding motility-associated C-terminal domain-containing protein [Bacteroidota bacterium]